MLVGGIIPQWPYFNYVHASEIFKFTWAYVRHIYVYIHTYIACIFTYICVLNVYVYAYVYAYVCAFAYVHVFLIGTMYYVRCTAEYVICNMC